jgi:hypothetical protein
MISQSYGPQFENNLILFALILRTVLFAYFGFQFRIAFYLFTVSWRDWWVDRRSWHVTLYSDTDRNVTDNSVSVPSSLQTQRKLNHNFVDNVMRLWHVVSYLKKWQGNIWTWYISLIPWFHLSTLCIIIFPVTILPPSKHLLLKKQSIKYIIF